MFKTMPLWDELCAALEGRSEKFIFETGYLFFYVENV